MNEYNFSRRAETPIAPYYRLDAFDPGGSTGVSTFILDWSPKIGSAFDRIRWWDTTLIEGNDIEQWKQIHEYLWDYAEGRHTVVSEAFILNMFTMDEELLSPVRHNSLLKWFCWQSKSPICFQPRELAMSTCTNERLQRWGFYTKQKDIRASVKHGLTFIRRCHDNKKLREEYFSGVALL